MHSKKATPPRAVSIEGENRFLFNGKQPSGYVQKMNEGNFDLLGNNDRLEE
jgi:hypothetical protein